MIFIKKYYKNAIFHNYNQIKGSEEWRPVAQMLQT